MTVSAPAVIVIGDGVIGLSLAVTLQAEGANVTLIAPQLAGAASPASAGMLAPSVERTQGAGQTFADASGDAWLRLRETVIRLGAPSFRVDRDGILRVAPTADDVEGVRATMRPKDDWLDPHAARRLVPALGEIAGAALLEGDGVVHVAQALASLRAAVGMSGVRVLRKPATTIELRGGSTRVGFADGSVVSADVIAVAAGAWSGSIAGLPREIPVVPLRGTLVGVAMPPVPVPVYDASGHVYAFPRDSQTVLGATSDSAGFDSNPGRDDADRLTRLAARLFPGIADLPHTAPWSGLRPMTPDGLPVVGPDPQDARLIYTCGHGRNGFLEAAYSAEVVADQILGRTPRVDLTPFRADRFDML